MTEQTGCKEEKTKKKGGGGGGGGGGQGEILHRAAVAFIME